jgi:hypothetical protein
MAISLVSGRDSDERSSAVDGGTIPAHLAALCGPPTYSLPTQNRLTSKTLAKAQSRSKAGWCGSPNFYFHRSGDLRWFFNYYDRIVAALPDAESPKWVVESLMAAAANWNKRKCAE